MKKFYAAIVFSILGVGAFAQCTPDNTITQPGYYPPYMDTAEAGKSYEMVIHLRIPEDTVVTFFGQTLTADIDSIRLVNVLGFPQGFSYQCNVSDCLFEPNQNYCAKVNGTPTTADVGNHPLRFAIVAYASAVVFGTRTALPPQADTLDQFELVVEGQGGTTGIYTINPKAKPLRVYPNPTKLKFTLWINVASTERVKYSVVDITGKQHFADEILAKNGEALIELPTNNLKMGIYFVNLYTENGVFTEKLIINN